MVCCLSNSFVFVFIHVLRKSVDCLGQWASWVGASGVLLKLPACNIKYPMYIIHNTVCGAQTVIIKHYVIHNTQYIIHKIQNTMRKS